MSGFNVSYGDQGRSLNVWFDHPFREHHRETKGENMILKKDAHGRVIGVEHRNYFSSNFPEIDESGD